MTQPEQAVGGDDAPVIAAEPTIEDRFAAFTDEEEKKPPPDAPQASDESENGDQPIIAAPDEEGAEESPEIKPPHSWPDEDKAIFAELPPELQERVSAREAEREKFVQAKSREVREVETRAQQAAIEVLTQARNLHFQQLQALLPQVPEEPSAHLQYQDPQGYAFALDAHKAAVAQHDWIVQQLGQIATAQQQAQQQALYDHAQTTLETLRDELPDYFDETKGPELKGTLESTARQLGFSDQEMTWFEARHYRALNDVSQWKTKAEKYDALMSKQMDNVRAAKNLPRVSKPGTARGKGALANERYTADREAMKQGNKEAESRVFARFLNT